MEQTLSRLQTDMSKHFADDVKEFKEIHDKLDLMHDIQITNQGLLRECLAGVQKTNGRVTNLELVTNRLDKSFALMEQTQITMSNILSRQHNQYENFIKQREQLDADRFSEFLTKDDFAPYKNGINGMVVVILLAVLGAGLTLIGLNIK
jgi:hypothetical protein